MDLSKLNQSIGLMANIGVLAGVIFLVLELNQSNRIATYTAEHELRAQSISSLDQRTEYADLMVKLKSENSELTPIELEQAQNIATLMNYNWADAEAAYNAGLLSERSFEVRMREIGYTFESYPRMAPIFASLLRGYEVNELEPIEVLSYQSELLANMGINY